MLIRNDQVLLALGTSSLAISIVLKRFVSPFVGEPILLDFIEGVLVGAALVLNMSYLIRLRKKKQSDGC
jgi:hypothetical protein